MQSSPVQEIKSNGRKKYAPKGLDHSKILATAQENPNLTQKEIATLHNCDRSLVSRLLAENNITKEEVEQFKKDEAFLLNNLRYRIYKNITDEELKKAPVGSKVLAYCQIYDKYRLETGQSTENSNVLVAAISDLKHRKLAGNHANDDSAIDVT